VAQEDRPKTLDYVICFQPSRNSDASRRTQQQTKGAVAVHRSKELRARSLSHRSARRRPVLGSKSSPSGSSQIEQWLVACPIRAQDCAQQQSSTAIQGQHFGLHGKKLPSQSFLGLAFQAGQRVQLLLLARPPTVVSRLRSFDSRQSVTVRAVRPSRLRERPGAFTQFAALTRGAKSLSRKPTIREKEDDHDNPGRRQAHVAHGCLGNVRHSSSYLVPLAVQGATGQPAIGLAVMSGIAERP
jgi:hypothetical protein